MDTSTGDASNCGGKLIPESVMEAVKRTSSNIDEVKTNLEEFLPYCDTEILAKMEPLERARALCSISVATTTLFALRLRCKGVNLNDHPIKKELERLSMYQEKLQRCTDLSRAPLRPSVAVNTRAAARVIGHSLPHLSHVQRQRMREISCGEGSQHKYLERSHGKKRKYQPSENKSIRAAAQEFLEKAASELLGDTKNGVKGPFQPVELEDDAIALE